MTKKQLDYKEITEQALIRIKATKEQLKIILNDLDKHLKEIESEKFK